MLALIISLIVLLFGFVIVLSYARFSSQKRQQALIEKRRQSVLATRTGFRQHLNEQMGEQENHVSEPEHTLDDDPSVYISQQLDVVENDASLRAQPSIDVQLPQEVQHADDIHTSVAVQQSDSHQTQGNNGLREWDELITLTILAPNDRPFEGRQIVQTLARFDLILGELGIYHRQPVHMTSPLFSLANLVSPGTLKPEQMAQLSTPGLAIFMPLPSAGNSLVVFDAMLEAAEGIAQHLNGRVCDKQRQVITASKLEQLRHRILTFNLTQQNEHPFLKHDYSR